MTNLDSVEAIRAQDPSNMYNAIFDMPEHLAEGIRLGTIWKFDPEEFAGIGNIVLIGMGGSAIAGDLLRSLVSSKLLIPFHVVRDYTLPEYVDDETLVIASSYSGNTEETIAAVEDALARKALVAAVTTGGLLQDICELNQIPMCQIPSGLQPRAALGYSFAALLVFLERINQVSGLVEDLKETIKGLTKYREVYIEDNPTEHNTAKNMAGHLADKTIVIYTGPTLTDSVGLRFKAQICENGKQLAFVNHFSEFNHNELEGWTARVEPIMEHVIVLILRDAEDRPEIRTRMNIVRDQIKELGVEVAELHTKGKTRMERLFSLVQFGDFISYYLAILNGIDPTPVTAIEHLKDQLAALKVPR